MMGPQSQMPRLIPRNCLYLSLWNLPRQHIQAQGRLGNVDFTQNGRVPTSHLGPSTEDGKEDGYCGTTSVL